MNAPEEIIDRITTDQVCPEDCFFVQRTARPLGQAVMAGEIDLAGARRQLSYDLNRHCPETKWEPLPGGRRLEFPACSYDLGGLGYDEYPFDFIESPTRIKESFGEDLFEK